LQGSIGHQEAQDKVIIPQRERFAVGSAAAQVAAAGKEALKPLAEGQTWLIRISPSSVAEKGQVANKLRQNSQRGISLYLPTDAPVRMSGACAETAFTTSEIGSGLGVGL
jgi:hypothetical protein